MDIISIAKDWSGLVAMAISIAVVFTRNQDTTVDNTKAIARLEDTIQRLVDKIDKLLDNQSDAKAEIAGLIARVTGLEARK